jgi:hypothetical protein
MAMTITRSGRMYTGDKRRTWGTIALDSSYATNGYTYTNPSLELSTVDMFSVLPQNGIVFDVDYTNKKVKAFWGDNTNVAASALAEVTNGTSLATVTTARWEAWGS